MPHRVQEVLLVASMYDAFTLEEYRKTALDGGWSEETPAATASEPAD